MRLTQLLLSVALLTAVTAPAPALADGSVTTISGTVSGSVLVNSALQITAYGSRDEARFTMWLGSVPVTGGSFSIDLPTSSQFAIVEVTGTGYAPTYAGADGSRGLVPLLINPISLASSVDIGHIDAVALGSIDLNVTQPIPQGRIALRNDAGGSLSGAPLFQYLSGSGSFTGLVPGLYSTKYWSLAGGKDVPSVRHIRVVAGQATQVGIDLRTSTVSGRVTTPKGQPVSGATVGADFISINEGFTTTTRTDSHGHYVLGGLPPGDHRIVYRKAGWMLGEKRVTTTLAPQVVNETTAGNSAITGTVKTGNTVDNLLIRLTGAPLGSTTLYTVVEQGKGKFSFSGLSSGRYTIIASSPKKFVSKSITVSGSKKFTIAPLTVSRKAFVLTGTVKGSTSGKVYIETLMDPRKSLETYPLGQATIRSNGTFTVKGVAPGRTTVRAYSHLDNTKNVPITISKDQTVSMPNPNIPRAGTKVTGILNYNGVSACVYLRSYNGELPEVTGANDGTSSNSDCVVTGTNFGTSEMTFTASSMNSQTLPAPFYFESADRYRAAFTHDRNFGAIPMRVAGG